MSEIRLALRSLLKSPGFAAVAVLSMALGIGANTAIFTLVNAVILRPLPVSDPEGLSLFTIPNAAPIGTTHGNTRVSFSYPAYRYLVENNAVFESILGRGATVLSLTHAGASERVNADLVSGNFFDVLGVRPVAGRLLTADDDRKPGEHPVAVLSHAYWMSRFGGDPRIVGGTIQLNSRAVQVVGVGPAGFEGAVLGRRFDVFVPLAMTGVYLPLPNRLNEPDRFWLQLIGRRKRGVSDGQAQAAVNVFYARWVGAQAPKFGAVVSQRGRERWLEQRIRLEPGGQGYPEVRRVSQQPLLVLMATVAFVLLIACANVANLQLARALQRGREFAIRVALGAGRGRLLRQLLVESLVVSLAGALLGMFVAMWAVTAVATFAPAGVVVPNLSPSPRIAAFTLALAVVSALLFGLAPAWRAARSDAAPALKAETGGVIGGSGFAGLGGALVAGQIALSLLLLVGAALFLKSLGNVLAIDLGFERANMMLATVNPALNGYKPEQAAAFFENLRTRVAALPGVRSVALARVPLLGNQNWESGIRVEGFHADDAESSSCRLNWVSPGYFAMLGVPFREGRDVSERDLSNSPKVAVVNEAFARLFFKGGSALGRRFGMGGRGAKMDLEIVGVVRDLKYRSPTEESTPVAYFPYQQSSVREMILHVRTTGAPAGVAPLIRQQVRDLDANVPLYDVRSLEAQIADSMSFERMMATLTAVFGGLATLLAGVGLYGVLSLSVARRTREIGIRMALGAERGAVLWMVTRGMLALTLAGVVAGLGASWALTRYVGSLLHGVKPMEPGVVVLAVAGILAAAVVSGLLPARRAAKVDPMRALRYE
ncbi:MAG: ABC transporter permease [Bryobacteraceae bacterium]|nr:ABC transporter permease [Bryobacteraceae bacterium]